jgi:fused signal recognition particle receptor
VLLAAGDTFRAAAREQLMTWGERNGVTVIAQEGGDPAAVVFDAISAARRARSTSCWPIPPAACRPSCT